MHPANSQRNFANIQQKYLLTQCYAFEVFEEKAEREIRQFHMRLNAYMLNNSGIRS